jgi:Lipase maturation factor
LPAERFVESLRGEVPFLELPSLLRFGASDAALLWLCWGGLALSLVVMLGLDSGLVLLVLWALYLSLSHVGQIFWGYGWEILLLETGFLAVFVCPFVGAPALRSPRPPSAAVMFLLRWLLCRLMLGAGLIKLRGDPCWRDLSCLAFHYETQPVPSPLSWLLHQMPLGFHEFGVAYNHLVELVLPLLLLGPRPFRQVAGALTAFFQLILIASGNLSFLNWLTLVVTIACFDDAFWARLLPARLAQRAVALEATRAPRRGPTVAVWILSCAVAVLSIGPVVNMLSPRQAMNTSFDPLHLVNSYGAFGSVGRTRHEIIIEGTLDPRPDASARWREYELRCKPGRVTRRPCLITPYHYRLDWQMWFAAMSRAPDEPWLMHLAYALLRARPEVLALFAHDPFGGRPPRFLRMELYEYRFTRWGESGWWRRKRVATYLPPVSADTPALREYLEAYDLLDSQ